MLRRLVEFSLFGKHIAYIVLHFEIVWREEHTTSVFQRLVDSPDRRVLVTAELQNWRGLNPMTEESEQVVFREAATGQELARTGLLPRMSDGANISPGFDGGYYFPGKDGTVYEVSVRSE